MAKSTGLCALAVSLGTPDSLSTESESSVGKNKGPHKARNDHPGVGQGSNIVQSLFTKAVCGEKKDGVVYPRLK